MKENNKYISNVIVILNITKCEKSLRWFIDMVNQLGIELSEFDITIDDIEYK